MPVLTMAFALPLAMMFIGWGGETMTLFMLAFIIQYAGLLIEHWVFFAEASHPQNLYYQKVA